MNGIGEVIANAARAAQEANPDCEGDYEVDGILYCGKCRTPKQKVIDILGRTMKVFCLCKCKSEEAEAKEQEEKRKKEYEAIMRLRAACTSDRSVREKTFANDKGICPRQMQIAKRYVDNWECAKRENVGLMFWGDTGNGKTYTAACIANALLDKRVPVLITSIPKLLMEISGIDAETKMGYINSLSRFDLVVIDDFGTERNTSYATELVYTIIDTRYKSGKPIIVTTNLTEKDIENPEGIESKRIYDRLEDMCVKVVFDGKSVRPKINQEKREILKRIVTGEVEPNEH